MPTTNQSLTSTLPRDLASGVVVFLVALPLCLGIALASGAPLLSGVLAGVVGGLVVSLLSGSHTSVSGPAAGLTAVVAAQIVSLGSFQTFLLAVVLAGFIQIALGLARAGFIAAFFPTSVIKGLLAAIGIILILKQIPHALGHDPDPDGDMAFLQPDQENTFTELFNSLFHIQPGATVIGLLSIALLIVWDRYKPLKKSLVPAPLVVVLLGIGLSLLFQDLGGVWVVESSHLVQVPVPETVSGFLNFLQSPDFTQLSKPAVYTAALTLAVVASLETLMNLEAIDKLDPQQRHSPASRELFAQGVGNVASGMIGGLPVTSVVVRGSVNINAGAKTKMSAFIHGAFLAGSVVLLPTWLNLIPLSCLGAILLMTGVKLISPTLVKQMWEKGRYQFIPFAATVVAIVFTDLLIGVVIGLVVSVAFILNSSMRRPVRRFMEKHLGGDVLHIELANQVSFLNRAALGRILDEVPRGGHVLLDALNTDYIDPDVLDLLREFKEKTAPARGVEVSLIGFLNKYHLIDQIQYVDYSTRELQATLTPTEVLRILKEGNERFRSGQRLTRDLGRQLQATARNQHPLAVILSCIDSRTPGELIFDMGVGDLFSIRIAGNITSRKVLASIEYGCAVAGAKLILVMGHTRCGAVTAAVNLIHESRPAAEITGCQHIDHIVSEIQHSVPETSKHRADQRSEAEQDAFVDDVARRNVSRVVELLREQSQTLDSLVTSGQIAIVGAMYEVGTGRIEMLDEPRTFSPIPSSAE